MPPQFATGGKTLEVLWADYRQEMISYAGIAIIIFGNKKNVDTGVIELAKGVYKEYEIAKAKKLFIIPIFATGSMAKQIFEEMENDSFGLKSDSELFGLMGQLKVLANEDEIIEQIQKIIKHLNL